MTMLAMGWLLLASCHGLLARAPCRAPRASPPRRPAPAAPRVPPLAMSDGDALSDDWLAGALDEADRLTAEAEHRPPAILMGLWFSGVMYRLAGVFCSGRALDSPMSTTGGSRGRER